MKPLETIIEENGFILCEASRVTNKIKPIRQKMMTIGFDGDDLVRAARRDLKKQPQGACRCKEQFYAIFTPDKGVLFYRNCKNEWEFLGCFDQGHLVAGFRVLNSKWRSGAAGEAL